MGASPTPRKPDPLLHAAAKVWAAVDPGRDRPCRWAVACSGGRDSVALLHAVVHLAHQQVQAGREARVTALHVHHGLSRHADAWAAHVQALVDGWRAQGLPVSVRVTHVQVDVGQGLSVEAEARRLRHVALQHMAMAEAADALWLGHHRRDQAETVLLQALRGAGVKGLAAMPAAQWRGAGGPHAASSAALAGVWWLRPWLAASNEDIARYVQAHALPHIEDDSNADVRWARNRLRHDVWPALGRAFPQAEVALGQVARHVADVLPVLHDWAESALAQDGVTGATWPLSAWARRPAPERRLLLAHWYARTAGHSLPATWVERLADEWPRLLEQERPWQSIPLGLSLYRGIASWCPPGPEAAGQSVVDRRSPGEGLASVDVQVIGPGRYPLPAWSMVLEVVPCREGGVAAGVAVWRIAPRHGGEQWQAHAGGPPRSLKKQFQAMAVPPWARQAPLVWVGDHLLWVPGLGVDARRRAPEGAEQWALRMHAMPR